MSRLSTRGQRFLSVLNSNALSNLQLWQFAAGIHKKGSCRASTAAVLISASRCFPPSPLAAPREKSPPRDIRNMRLRRFWPNPCLSQGVPQCLCRRTPASGPFLSFAVLYFFCECCGWTGGWTGGGRGTMKAGSKASSRA